MSASTATRMSCTLRLAGVCAVAAGTLALSAVAPSTSVRGAGAASGQGSVSSGPAVGDRGGHPTRLGHRVARSHLPDSAAAAKARGEARATSAGEAGVRPDQPVALPSGRAPGVHNAATSTNWSGIVGTGARGTFRGASGDWYVPQVYVSPENRWGSTWVGVDGHGTSSLIQAGAEEDYINGHAYYAAWWEILPAAETKIYLKSGALAPVAPGDFMYSYIYQTSPGVYRIFLDDVTQGWYYDQAHYYNGPGVSTEWVQEGSSINGQVSKPTNFGSVGFGYMYVDEGNTWYRTNFGAANEINIVQNGLAYTQTSVPTQTSPQTFTIRYTGN